MPVLAVREEIGPGPMIRFFSNDANVIAFGSDYLRIVAFNFVAAGIVFTSSSMFQGLGNTVPPLLSSASRLFLFALPALLLSQKPGFDIKQRRQRERSEEHTSELQSHLNLVCRLLLEKKKKY